MSFSLERQGNYPIEKRYHIDEQIIFALCQAYWASDTNVRNIFPDFRNPDSRCFDCKHMRSSRLRLVAPRPAHTGNQREPHFFPSKRQGFMSLPFHLCFLFSASDNMFNVLEIAFRRPAIQESIIDLRRNLFHLFQIVR